MAGRESRSRSATCRRCTRSAGHSLQSRESTYWPCSGATGGHRPGRRRTGRRRRKNNPTPRSAGGRCGQAGPAARRWAGSYRCCSCPIPSPSLRTLRAPPRWETLWETRRRCHIVFRIRTTPCRGNTLAARPRIRPGPGARGRRAGARRASSRMKGRVGRVQSRLQWRCPRAQLRWGLPGGRFAATRSRVEIAPNNARCPSVSAPQCAQSNKPGAASRCWPCCARDCWSPCGRRPRERSVGRPKRAVPLRRLLAAGKTLAKAALSAFAESFGAHLDYTCQVSQRLFGA